MMRGSGVTKQQMLDAPAGAIFVWCNVSLDYPRALAHDIGRNDLLVKPRSWIGDERNWLGIQKPVVLDHAACEFITEREREGWLRLCARMQRGGRLMDCERSSAALTKR